MNVLWLFAHPDPHSLGGALRDEGLATLRALGHDVCESDLYAMGWNPVVDEIATTPPDVEAEQAKLTWADAVVVQFPFWWYGTPAILKGWFDRVFVKGYAYDVRGCDGRTLRYGEGALAGKRALVVVTTGSTAPALGPRGVNGPLTDLLFGLQHGTLFYTGMSVLPPFAVYDADRMTACAYACAVSGLRERLRALGTTTPLPFRTQNGGDYGRDLVLRPDLAPGREGLGVHLG
ncbi:NAD(P)H-dependent oxidoreductase [Amycolatopsis sp. FDAARGOS 1241]|uniref:NAD(P)H-dependent oxidoreductase n=1 Tax=Amycolatopsis sp. FDAARGOS 1241 TaxID=2778070 RepID=UPI00194DC1E6|nr:NAD(P)H-dependent oxidoreductase [Amycolatopsis sp. FDAARGOS 1241]QRP45160.1 NAD(P)H-dependent oxidoreductase [Amycolatopsis sp. FDAARGOS 1241]